MSASLLSLKLTTAVIVLFGTGTLLNSQDATVTTITETVTAITVPSPGEQQQLPVGERLAALREVNAQLLKKQAETLERLEKLERDARQLRIFTKRG